MVLLFPLFYLYHIIRPSLLIPYAICICLTNSVATFSLWSCGVGFWFLMSIEKELSIIEETWNVWCQQHEGYSWVRFFRELVPNSLEAIKKMEGLKRKTFQRFPMINYLNFSKHVKRKIVKKRRLFNVKGNAYKKMVKEIMESIFMFQRLVCYYNSKSHAKTNMWFLPPLWSVAIYFENKCWELHIHFKDSYLA